MMMQYWSMKIATLLLGICLLALAGRSSGQDFKKEFVDPMPQESRSAAGKAKAGKILFRAGHTAPLPQANAELGNFDAQFKRVFDKIKTTLSQGGATFNDIVTMSVFLTDLRYIPEFNKLLISS